MFHSGACRLAVSAALVISFAQVAFAADILIGNAKSSPESWEDKLLRGIRTKIVHNYYNFA